MVETMLRCVGCGEPIEVPAQEQDFLSGAFCLACQKERESRSLSRYILQEKRQFVTDKVQGPILKAIITLVKRLEKEPTRANTKNPNTHTWLDIKDWFLEHERNAGRKPFFEAIWKLFATKHEVDVFYGERIQRTLEKWLEAVLAGKWKPRSLDYKLGDWQDELPGEGYHFIKECYNKAKKQ